MEYIIKVALILVFELNIFYCIGFLMDRVKIFPKEESVMGRVISGFVGYHFVFLCVSFPQSIWGGTLNSVTLIWSIILLTTLSVVLIKFVKPILQSYKQFILKCWKYRLYIIPCLVSLLFLIYYVCVNGQNDIDARTYIGEVTSIFDTNKLVGVFIPTGEEMDVVGARRVFSMFGVNSAVMCKIFALHPLLYCRTVRAAINVILLAVATFSILKWVYRDREDKIEQAIMVTMLSMVTLFLFTNSIYTSSSFILYRAYEGKAYTSGALVMIALYICIRFCSNQDEKYFYVLFLTMVATMSISATATLVIPLLVGGILLSYIIIERKWKLLLKLIMSLSPNIIYIILCISGIGMFSLEG